MPVLGRISQKKAFSPQMPTNPKTPVTKANKSILSFFQKVDSPIIGAGGLFLGEEKATHVTKQQDPTEISAHDELYDTSSLTTSHLAHFPIPSLSNYENDFNEHEGQRKKRRLSGDQDITERLSKNDANSSIMSLETTEMIDPVANRPLDNMQVTNKSKKHRRCGPFIDQSDDDMDLEDLTMPHVSERALSGEDGTFVNPAFRFDTAITWAGQATAQSEFKQNKQVSKSETEVCPVESKPSDGAVNGDLTRKETTHHIAAGLVSKTDETVSNVPHLKSEYTSIDGWAESDDLDDMRDFADEFAEDGEEFMERKWMEEQAGLDLESGEETNLDIRHTNDEEIRPACPLCSASLEGLKEVEATRHVNACLDGNPIPVVPSIAKAESFTTTLMPENASKRFARRAAQPRPGQANPFDLEGNDRTEASSAFSKLMSGHAEDAAWATAAAAENAARGKPAYQRTCPFYKIMPGFFICVDAFRYGAVKGCNAYFLSHFHSDHYIGLTSMWCHGPIYCSKVTANLVRQQLKVDPQYVVPLEFEQKSEVPGTQGVFVTMISANHCPGSSLFLFEKAIGRGSNPKVQRVLHCGDFRACPAHIEHPMLMPDIVDAVSGKKKNQKIDVCYLDTTYLNPRYAFPSQEEVISACADMCVSLSKERAEESDAWEISKKERAGTGMSKYVSATVVKAEDGDTQEQKPRARGRLLIICGTYSIGKERICMGIARALDCKIYATRAKMRICAALEDPELMSRMTPHPLEAQIHMQSLMEIRPETLGSYLDSFRPHFSRIVAFRPSGWNYKPPISRGLDVASVENILKGKNWKSHFGYADLVAQRGSTREVMCFGVPYSEHSSFRELTMFVCALRIEKVVPTVNVGSAKGRAAMRAWVERWMAERKKAVGGVVKFGDADGDVQW